MQGSGQREEHPMRTALIIILAAMALAAMLTLPG